MVPSCPANVLPFWAIIEPLTQQRDVVQLWNDFLDLFIGNYLVDERNNVPNFGEHFIQRDYDRAVSSCPVGSPLRTGLQQLSILLAQGMAEYMRKSVVEFKGNNMQTESQVLNSMVCMASAYQGAWYDLLGDIHTWLCFQFPDHAALQPCCAGPEMTMRWAKAQFVRENEGQPISLNNKLTVANPACGSGRTALAMQSLQPGGYYFVQQADDPLHAKMTVINLLLHGCHGQVELVAKHDKNEFVRCWDINRFLFAKAAPDPAIVEVLHVFAVPKEISHTWRQRHHKDGKLRANADAHELQLQLEQMNRLSDGLGIGLKISGDANALFIKGDDMPEQPAPSGKAGSLKKRLFASMQQASAKKKKATTVEELFGRMVAPTEPVAVAAPPEPTPEPPRRTMARRR